MKNLIIVSFLLVQTLHAIPQSESLFPVSQSLQSVFKILNPLNDKFGSSVLVTSDVKKSVFLITCKHIFDQKELIEGQSIKFKLFRQEHWVDFKGIIHFPQNNNVDIIAIEIPDQEWIKNKFGIGMADIYLGQEVFFLGFPLGLETKVSNSSNNGFNLPWVKYARISSFFNDNGVISIFLDGMNNKGFSGGPVFCMINNQLTLIGIVKSYYTSELKIMYDNKSLVFPENTGIIICHSATYINELINR